jgi:hypothetical protein
MLEHRTPFIQRRHYMASSRTGRSGRFFSREMEMDGGHFCADRSQMSTIRPPVDNSTVGRIKGKPEDVGQSSFYRPLGSDPATFSPSGLFQHTFTLNCQMIAELEESAQSGNAEV